LGLHRNTTSARVFRDVSLHPTASIRPLVRILEDFPMLWIDTLGDRLAVVSTLALILSTLATVGLGMTVLG